MASLEEASPVGAKPGRKNRLTVMIMGSVGRVFSFQISSRMFLGSSISFVMYILFSLFVINDYTQLRMAFNQDREKYSRLEEEHSANKKTMTRFKHQIAMLEGYIRHIEEDAEGSGAVRKDPVRSNGEKIPLQPTLPEKVAKEPQVVDVTDVVIQKEGSGMSINLKLVNIQAVEGPIGGYIHLIASDKKSVVPKEWSYPQGKIEKGMPVNYRKGQIFLIQKFKQIHARIHLGAPSESPSAIKVLVYDQSGEIILHKEMDVTQGS
jgi:hypothetical protein